MKPALSIPDGFEVVTVDDLPAPGYRLLNLRVIEATRPGLRALLTLIHGRRFNIAATIRLAMATHRGRRRF